MYHNTNDTRNNLYNDYLFDATLELNTILDYLSRKENNNIQNPRWILHIQQYTNLYCR